MNLNEFSDANRQRCESADGFNHALDSWSMSDWMTAATGELGEAANLIKKLNRVRDGIPGNGKTTPAELQQQLGEEIADAIIYLDLLAQRCGFQTSAIIAAKWNKTSAKIGSPLRVCE